MSRRTLLGGRGPVCRTALVLVGSVRFTLQIAGVPDAGITTVSRDLGGGAEILFHLDAQGRLVAAGGLGAIEKIGKEIKLSERLIARRASPVAAALANPGVSLKKLS